MTHVLLFFIDGIGIGADDRARNPFVAYGSTLGSGIPLTSNHILSSSMATLIPTDACLGIPGRPQSATGQTTLLTGINAAQLLSKHLHAYPNALLTNLLAEHSIFAWCKSNHLAATFANSYRQEYWELLKQRKLRHSATTLSVLGSQGTLRAESDYADGAALFHDITGESINAHGYPVAILTPQQAALRLANLTMKHHFTLFEYFLTDIVGHKTDWNKAKQILNTLDLFISHLLLSLDLNQVSVILTSDHGNFEDFSTSLHTENLVPTILYGKNNQNFNDKIHSLTDIKQTICDLLQ